MGKTAAAPVVALGLTLDDVQLMGQKESRGALIEFCDLNAHTKQARDGAFDLLKRAVKSTGTPIEVPTMWTNGGTARAQAVHDCMQSITDNPVAHDLAIRAFDAAPGTHFEHSLREDACVLTNTCTNAV